MRSLAFACALLALAAIGSGAGPENRGVVAVVPTINSSGEKWAELKQKQVAKIEEWIGAHLPAAGYSLAPAKDVAEAVRGLDLDMTEEENWRKTVLAQVGAKVGADYVLFCVVTHTEQKEQKRTWYMDKEGRTDVRVWLVDTRSGKATPAGKTFTGRSGGNRISIDNKGSERQIQAAANAVRDALREFLAPYKAK